MITKFKIVNPIPFGSEGCTFDNIKTVNLIYGSNGTGKTSISRLLAKPDSSLTGNSVHWDSGDECVTYVYNSDFVQENLLEHQKAIYTLGKENVEVSKDLEQLQTKKNDYILLKSEYEVALGSSDQKSGKVFELNAANEALKNEVWLQMAKIPDSLQPAFSGYKNSKQKCLEKVEELLHKTSTEDENIDGLLEAAEVLYSKSISPKDEIVIPEIVAGDEGAFEALLRRTENGNGNQILSDIFLSLEHHDWVYQGLGFVAGVGHQCPFCRQDVSNDLRITIKALFESDFGKYIGLLENARKQYAEYSNSIRNFVELVREQMSALGETDWQNYLRNLERTMAINGSHFKAKLVNPSTPLNYEPLQQDLDQLRAHLMQLKMKVEKHNSLMSSKANEREKLTERIWLHLAHQMQKLASDKLLIKSNALKAKQGLETKIERNLELLENIDEEINRTSHGFVSIQPSIDRINKILTNFGFTSFSLASAGVKMEQYKIVRPDGSSAHKTLSEGEKTFVTFLYFYCLAEGALAESDIHKNRVLVIDDPISSLDSEILYVITSLVQELLSLCQKPASPVRQVFILTHNLYFHKQISQKVKHLEDLKQEDIHYWILRKQSGRTVIESFVNNPIQGGYNLLWKELSRNEHDGIALANTMRRILEYYFNFLGESNLIRCLEKFEGPEKQISHSLISWLHDSSHNFGDDLYAPFSNDLVERYKCVFEEIFTNSGNADHFEMMTKLSKDERPSTLD